MFWNGVASHEPSVAWWTWVIRSPVRAIHALPFGVIVQADHRRVVNRRLNTVQLRKQLCRLPASLWDGEILISDMRLETSMPQVSARCEVAARSAGKRTFVDAAPEGGRRRMPRAHFLIVAGVIMSSR